MQQLIPSLFLERFNNKKATLIYIKTIIGPVEVDKTSLFNKIKHSTDLKSITVTTRMDCGCELVFIEYINF